MDKEKADKFFENIGFYNKNLKKYFGGYEKNYQFGIIRRFQDSKEACLVINDDEGYFRGIITLLFNNPHRVINQEGENIGSYCWDDNLCSIEKDGPREKENAIEFILRKSEQIREEKYKIRDLEK